VLEVLEDPLPALLLVGRAGGGCAARFRRHVPAAASLPPSLPSLPPSVLPSLGESGARKRMVCVAFRILFYGSSTRSREREKGRRRRREGERPLAWYGH
jgi:hypothetical protein